MKICHVTSVHSFNDNRIFYKEVLSLNEAGYDVCYIAPNAPAEFHGVPIYSNDFTGGRLKRVLYQSWYKTVQHAMRAKADVYHLHDPELMPVALFLRILGKRVVFDVHENTPAAILSKPYLNNSLIRRFVSLLVDMAERTFLMFCNRIVTARPDISERLGTYDPVTLRNFPVLPADDELARQAAALNIQKSKKSVIYVGGMTEIRGNLELVEAFDQFDDIELWLLGPIRGQDFEERLRGSRGWRNTRYFGVVEPTEVFGYIQKADAGIVTFWPEPNHVRTLATKPFEYMACGLPLIMSDFGYWRDFFGNSSVYVDPKDPDSIAGGIRRLFSDDDLRTSMSAANLEKSRSEYNWRCERERLFDVYSDLDLASAQRAR